MSMESFGDYLHEQPEGDGFQEKDATFQTTFGGKWWPVSWPDLAR